VSFFEAAEVTIGPVNDTVRLMNDRHVHARGLLADYPDEDMGSFPMHAIPVRLSGTPGSIRTPAPRLGQHSRDILSEVGLSQHDIDAALASGLVKEIKT
jgi:crotonobetainyl-CoA:carnitine CoA-transferase CaiB-like acyl-CoA transferase